MVKNYKKITSFKNIYNQMTNNFLETIKAEIRATKNKSDRNLKALKIIKLKLTEAKSREINSLQNKINFITRNIKAKIYEQAKFFLSGSIIKDTYVYGLSDVDILMALNKQNFLNISPRHIQQKLINQLRVIFPRLVVKKNRNAVDIYDGQIKIQLVPVLPNQTKFLFPASDGLGWIEIEPHIFNKLLQERNKKLRHKLTTAIRIAKLIVSKLPQNNQLTGHHLEVLGYLASGHFGKKKSILSLIKDIFLYAQKRVLTPVKDTSGQLNFIDEYLGPTHAHLFSLNVFFRSNKSPFFVNVTSSFRNNT